MRLRTRLRDAGPGGRHSECQCHHASDDCKGEVECGPEDQACEERGALLQGLKSGQQGAEWLTYSNEALMMAS